MTRMQAQDIARWVEEDHGLSAHARRASFGDGYVAVIRFEGQPHICNSVFQVERVVRGIEDYLGLSIEDDEDEDEEIED